LETSEEHHLSYSTEVDFSVAAYFTAYFARLLLERSMPSDVYVLKVDVPQNATRQTPWSMTRMSMHRYFEPLKPVRSTWDQPEKVGYRRANDIYLDPPDTDVYAVSVARIVSVTPISLDLTSRVNLAEIDELLRKQAEAANCGSSR